MCDVLIIEREKSCHVFCEWGYVALFTVAPAMCPACGGEWTRPRFRECKSANN